MIVPGSHKANFPLPNDLAECDEVTEEHDYLINPAMQPGNAVVLPLIVDDVIPFKRAFQSNLSSAGDVCIFSEATTHGALPWKGGSDSRQTLFYRYCPPNFGYGRGYVDRYDDLIAELSPAQRVVLQPPFTNRLDREHLEDGGGVGITPRSKEKKAFDKEVFDSEYF